MKPKVFVVLSVLLGVMGQLFMKQGMLSLGILPPPGISLVFAVMFQPFVIAGLTCYAGAMVIWLAVLAELDLSYAYPLLSSGYILVALGSWWMFDESIPPVRWAGILVIFSGVVITARQ